VNPPKDPTKGVDLRGRTMARKAKGNPKHCPLGKDKAILPSE
jgi:hypothetical protein